MKILRKVAPWLLGASVVLCLFLSCKGLWHIDSGYKDEKGNEYSIVIDNDTKDSSCDEENKN